MSSRSVLFAVVFLLVAGCREQQLREVSGGLLAEIEELRFGRTFVGHPTRLALGVRNTGRGDRKVAVGLSGPFRLSEAPLEIPAGSRLELELVFDPPGPGEHSGRLVLEGDGERLELPVSGLAEAPPECRPSAPCRVASFDAATGGCVEEAAADGAPCERACVASSFCVGGACVGEPISCSDGNACTEDACDPTRGCLHLELACPAAEDPCKAAYCDPVHGCRAADAADGTRCGESDCVSARVCMAGQCRSVAVPEGAECAAASPCQGPGVCRAQVCERPAATKLEPAWTYSRASGIQILFPGVADAAESLYWLECARSCELVSVTRDGLPRFRTSLHGASTSGELARGRVMVADTGVVVVASGELLEAVRAVDGVVGFRVNLRAELMPEVAAGWMEVGPVVDGGGGRLFAVANGFRYVGSSASFHGGWVVALSGSTGAVLWTRSYDGFLSGLLADRAGGLYVHRTSSGAGAGPELISLDALGAERYRASPSHARPLATSGGRIADLSGRLVRTADGQLESVIGWGEPVGYSGAEAVTPLLEAGAGYFVTGNGGCVADYGPGQGVSLAKFDPGTGLIAWQLPLSALGSTKARNSYAAELLSQPALTAARSVLLASGSWDTTATPWRLHEISPDREVVFSCELPGEGDFSGPTVLLEGRWVGSRAQPGVVDAREVVAFDVPGLSPAKHGWSALGGSATGAGRPR